MWFLTRDWLTFLAMNQNTSPALIPAEGPIMSRRIAYRICLISGGKFRRKTKSLSRSLLTRITIRNIGIDSTNQNLTVSNLLRKFRKSVIEDAKIVKKLIRYVTA
jgi:hypothetical protein